MKILIRWLILALSIMIAAYYLPGASVSGFWAAIWVALFLSLVNMILRPILVILTLPINIVTLGLFTFVINALLVWLTATVIKGFTVDDFFSALLFSVCVSIVSYILNMLLGTKRK